MTNPANLTRYRSEHFATVDKLLTTDMEVFLGCDPTFMDMVDYLDDVRELQDKMCALKDHLLRMIGQQLAKFGAANV